MSEGKRRRPKRRRVCDTTNGHAAAAAQASQPSEPWRPCGDDWPTARIQAALDCWSMLPPPPTLMSSSENSLPSFPFIVCQPRRRSYQQSRDGSMDTSIYRYAVQACKLPMIPAPPTSAVMTMTTATNVDSNVTTNIQPSTLIEKNKHRYQQLQSRDLTGATVRINRGQYLGNTGIITEKMDVHLLQLDSVPTPLAICDVRVMHYEDDASSDGFDEDGITDSGAGRRRGLDDEDVPTSIDADSDRIKKKYTGAMVYVAPNSNANREYWGVSGTVLRVLALGDWYILDNQNVEMAFRASSLDVLRYADECSVNGDADVMIERNDDDDNHDGEVAAGVKEAVDMNEICPGQQPTVIRDEYSVPLCMMSTTNESSTEAEQENERDEDLRTHHPSDNIESECVEDTSSKTPIEIDDSTKRDENDDVMDVDGATVVEKVEICNMQQPVLLSIDSNNVKVENSDESDKWRSNNDAKEDGRVEEVNERDALLASKMIGNETSDNTFPDVTEITGHPPTTFENATAEKDTIVDESPKNPEVYSVKLPTIESIELAARLSAFDSFLFLAHRRHTWGPALDTTNKDADAATAQVLDQGEGDMEDISLPRSNQDDDDRSKMIGGEVSMKSALSASTTVRNEIDRAINVPRTRRDGDRGKAEVNAQRNVVFDLNRQHRESRNLPTAMVLPGTEVLIDGEQQQQPLRIVPLEERIVRLVPGSLAERVELTERLGAFDDYMFLLGK